MISTNFDIDKYRYIPYLTASKGDNHMSFYYSPDLVRTLMDERLREIHKDELLHCCLELEADEPERSIQDRLRNLFRRQSPAACACEC
jgi:hypothetical protein